MEITINLPEVAAAIYALASSVASLSEVLEGRIPTAPTAATDVNVDPALCTAQVTQATPPPVNPQATGGIVSQAAPIPLNQQAAPAQMAPVPAPIVPTTPLTYTLESLAKAATQLVDAGRRDILVGLLATFGIPALTALPPEQYGNFASHLRANGAQL